uniref:Protein CNPPD1 n=1 Tax=Toxocara canis TaxID=6265 RepID=A0A183U0C2_TOXCA
LANESVIIIRFVASSNCRMAPRSLGYKQVQQRMRRSLKYGSRRMRSLSLPLSELLVDYFDKYAPYDYMDMDFATSLARESCVDACTFLVAMVYVDRVRHADKLYFETSDPGEIYLSALVVASKYLYDGGLEEFVYNDEWAISAGRPLKRVNELELELLDLLSWNISVDEAEFSHVLNEAECWVAREAMLRQGFCTYNEAAILGNDSKFLFEALKSLLSILAAVMLLYSALAYSILLAPRLPMSSSRPTNGNVFIVKRFEFSIDAEDYASEMVSASQRLTIDGNIRPQAILFGIEFEWYGSKRSCPAANGEGDYPGIPGLLEGDQDLHSANPGKKGIFKKIHPKV